MKNTKRQGSILIIVIVAIAFAAIGGLAYYALAPKPTASPSPVASVAVATATPTTTPTPAKTSKFTAGEVVFELPTGWKETSTIATGAEGMHTFSNASSADYVNVRIFVGGGDRASDSFWRYKLGGDSNKSFVLLEEEADCNPQGMCQIGDGMLKIGVVIADLPEGMLGGKYYEIDLGNTKSETADRQIYRDIMKAARIR